MQVHQRNKNDTTISEIQIEQKKYLTVEIWTLMPFEIL